MTKKGYSQDTELPISAKDIMRLFDLPSCMEVGMLMVAAENAIRERRITNDFDSVYEYLQETALKMKLI